MIFAEKLRVSARPRKLTFTDPRNNAPPVSTGICHAHTAVTFGDPAVSFMLEERSERDLPATVATHTGPTMRDPRPAIGALGLRVIEATSVWPARGFGVLSPTIESRTGLVLIWKLHGVR